MLKLKSFLLVTLGLFLGATTALADPALERIACAKPTSQAHKLICNDPHLKRIVVDTSRTYAALRQRTFEQAKQALDNEQKSWRAFRDSDCDTAFNKPFKGPQKKPKRLCLTRHFEERLITLDQRLERVGAKKPSVTASLKKAAVLLPNGDYQVVESYGNLGIAARRLHIAADKILFGENYCLAPQYELFGIENYFFFKNNFDVKDPGLLGWPNRSGARSLSVKVSCKSGSLGQASVFLIGKPGRVGLMADKTSFLIFEKN